VFEKDLIRGKRDSAASHFSFFALTFAWSWACWVLSSIMKTEASVTARALFLIGGFGPGIAAVSVVGFCCGRIGLLHWLGRCLQWRVGWCWFGLALALPVIVMGMAAAVHVLLGGTMPPSPAIGHGLMVAANFVLVFLVGGPLGEEFGWRGYALPELQKRWGWQTASIVLGALWGIWHVPLFYINGTSQSQTSILTFSVSAVALSVVFSALFNQTRQSVLPALVLHTAINSLPSIIPVMPSNDEPRPYQLVVGILALVAIGLLFFNGPEARRQAQDNDTDH